jgi:hypothetical protein
VREAAASKRLERAERPEQIILSMRSALISSDQYPGRRRGLEMQLAPSDLGALTSAKSNDFAATSAPR